MKRMGWSVVLVAAVAATTAAAAESSEIQSDRSSKQDFAPVDGDEVLQKLVELPIQSWSYKTEPGVRHIGPMAQDWNTAFHTGKDARTISAVDANGVTLAAVQALAKRVAALEAENEELRADRKAQHVALKRAEVF